MARGTTSGATVALMMQAAAEAQSIGMNARQMVITDRPKIATLEQQQAALAQAQADLAALANQLGAAIPAADKVHAELQKQIDALKQNADLTALAGRVTALEQLKVIVGFGQTTLTGTLLAGATQNVTVTLSRDMGSATYAPGYSLTGGTGLLGNLSITGIVSQTNRTVTLQIRNTAVLGLTLTNAVVSVVAAREV